MKEVVTSTISRELRLVFYCVPRKQFAAQCSGELFEMPSVNLIYLKSREILGASRITIW